MTGESRFTTYADFWPHYLQQHSRRSVRQVHIAGTLLASLALLKAMWSLSLIWLGVALVIGYGAAWLAHGVIEKNKPATFEYPLWSLRGDFQMLYLWLTGRLENELVRYKIMT